MGKVSHGLGGTHQLLSPFFEGKTWGGGGRYFYPHMTLLFFLSQPLPCASLESPTLPYSYIHLGRTNQSLYHFLRLRSSHLLLSQYACHRKHPAASARDDCGASSGGCRAARKFTATSYGFLTVTDSDGSQRATETMTAEPVSMRGGNGGDICCGM
jgi:hypothetical protein